MTNKDGNALNSLVPIKTPFKEVVSKWDTATELNDPLVHPVNVVDVVPVYVIYSFSILIEPFDGNCVVDATVIVVIESVMEPSKVVEPPTKSVVELPTDIMLLCGFNTILIYIYFIRFF